ncbi:hypothetical protein AXF42_Ash008133 [Apostasia shenzhenica]|uniref:Uncharacterized protein n=1 Tax=Apostasia shenzhenica TaxID=1088818 RepID=A0A2I0A8P1_9ASPA|nr:hypothetical protein AXF42_Ash008133 [Apostasia shenzhenica]
MEITGASGSLEDYIPDGNFCATTKRQGSDENLPPLDQLASSAVGSKRSRKGGRCNLRKSLAWNPAFFTEEGVLDPSELSMISSSLTKTSGKAPPRINSEKSQVILYESYTGESQPNNLNENLSSNVQLRSISQNDGKKASKLSLSEESINNGPRMLTVSLESSVA